MSGQKSAPVDLAKVDQPSSADTPGTPNPGQALSSPAVGPSDYSSSASPLANRGGTGVPGGK